MEENKENVVEETTQATEQPVEEVKFKSADDESVTKVDLSKPPKTKEEKNETKEEVKQDNADDSGVVAVDENADTTQEQEKVSEETETQEEQPVLEEVTEEEVKEQAEELTEEVEEAVAQAEEAGTPLPENLQKVVDFMEETGGSLEDYVRLNQDFSKYDDMTVLREYYKQTKSHLSTEEIEFMIEDSFSYNEEDDNEREIKKKKIALKEQVASAKAHLDGQKSKYYEEIKAGSKLTNEQQKAVDFFNRYNKESEETKKVVDNNTKVFEQKTNNLFTDKFKGFAYDVGDKKYRFNVKNVSDVKQKQSDLNNFMTKFVDKNSTLVDAEGYHKGLFTAMNPDAVAKHFYEQGKSDALKQSIAKAKNVDMQPRQAFGEVKADGLKVRVLGNNSSDFKFKIKNNK
tara:strand:- start:903 stop:2105 length:1203 start_codon:yes stop_codon:yes gene_type:complete